MPVIVPKVIGMGRAAAEAALDAKLLRHIARFPFNAAGDGSASAQIPAVGASVPAFSVVVVDYPSPMGPLPDGSVEGPTLQAGIYEGKITSVMAGDPWGTGQGAWVTVDTLIGIQAASISAMLYFDQTETVSTPVERTEWMRRGAMLGIAQRAFTNAHKVRVTIMADLAVRSIEILT